MTNEKESLLAWMLQDADRCAGIVADAYAGWDMDKPWMDALLAEIQHQRLHPVGGEKKA